MLKIRYATFEDIPEVVVLSKTMHKETRFSKFDISEK